MLLPFVIILAALGAAVVFRGRKVRGLLVVLVANMTAAASAASLARWSWTAFSLAMVGVAMVGIAIARRDPVPATTPEPEPAPEPDERSSDYCWTHQQIEKRDEK